MPRWDNDPHWYFNNVGVPSDIGQPTQMVMALVLPLLWALMWHLLRRFHVGIHWSHRLGIVAVWLLLGSFLRWLNFHPRIPGVWELVFFPPHPFLVSSRFTGIASSTSGSGSLYPAFGMLVGFAIVVECIFLHRFLWLTPLSESTQGDEGQEKAGETSEELTPSPAA